MVQIPYIPERDILHMRTWFRELEARLARYIDRRLRRAPQRDDMAMFRTTQSIPAATVSGTEITPGFLSATFLFLTDTAGINFDVRTGSQQRIYNKTTSAIPPGVHYAHREFRTGLWFVIDTAATTTQHVKIGRTGGSAIAPNESATISIYRRPTFDPVADIATLTAMPIAGLTDGDQFQTPDNAVFTWDSSATSGDHEPDDKANPGVDPGYWVQEPASALNPVDTSEIVEAWHDWLTLGQSIPPNSDVFLTRYDDEGGIWRITGAPCEST